MTQARRQELATAEDRGDNTPPRSRLSLAKGSEAPVTSPALELQRALDEMLTTTNAPVIDYGRSLIVAAGLFATVATCTAFWWMAATWAAANLR